MSANSGSAEQVTVTKEKLEQFERGEIGLDAFKGGERAYLESLLAGETAAGEAPPADAGVKEVTDTNQAVEDKSETPKGYVDGLKYKEAKDSENAYRQRADSLAKRLAETEAELESARQLAALKVEPQVPKDDALWTDNHQVDVATRLAKLEALTMQGVRGAEEKLSKLAKELEEQKNFAEVNAFIQSNPELRLGRPFEEANAEYLAFAQKLGATPKDMSAVDKFFEDANFRKEAESKGIKAPKDYDKLSVILDVYHRKSKYPNIDDAYLGLLRETKQLEKRFNGTYLKGVEDAVNKIANNKNETTILDPGTSNETGFSMTEAQMEAWLVKHPKPVTAADKAVMKQIQSYLEARANG